ncbi:hypothetical protein CAOG_04386 [Capsaspora owczarzaki ATCC 30864]|uniref:Uncharacterized protein n=1 Tax=Capsaspora owczarzaki (strain ATCC 30864) TaxID=595528 RepID=A0A0D2VRU3_CAPO3|nr:hypothetical protein CAOG_04386 [Capsaspora owczarzaki ATCC 30864]KJE93627.1 hypothetical protein CAOG_004386 [Capsaspora owczarzaki ATCC 30864]|eukprot:XP_004348214.1 hypothetical protein CAOG_04386 [Capsaspora owczarzaki ATCC 30864]
MSRWLLQPTDPDADGLPVAIDEIERGWPSLLQWMIGAQTPPTASPPLVKQQPSGPNETPAADCEQPMLDVEPALHPAMPQLQPALCVRIEDIAAAKQQQQIALLSSHSSLPAVGGSGRVSRAEDQPPSKHMHDAAGPTADMRDTQPMVGAPTTNEVSLWNAVTTLGGGASSRLPFGKYLTSMEATQPLLAPADEAQRQLSGLSSDKRILAQLAISVNMRLREAQIEVAAAHASTVTDSRDMQQPFTLADWVAWNGDATDLTPDEIQLGDLAVALFNTDEDAEHFFRKMSVMRRAFDEEQEQLRVQALDLYVESFNQQLALSASSAPQMHQLGDSVSMPQLSGNHSRFQSPLRSGSSYSGFDLPTHTSPQTPPSRGTPISSDHPPLTATNSHSPMLSTSSIHMAIAPPSLADTDLSGLSATDVELLAAKIETMNIVLAEEQQELETQEREIQQMYLDEQRARQLENEQQAEAQAPRTKAAKARQLLTAFSARGSSLANTIASNARSTVVAAATSLSPANLRKGPS